MPTNPIRKHFTKTIKDFYKEYKCDHPYPEEDRIEYKVYRQIVETFFLEIFKKVIYENFTFMMPYSLGSVLVKAFNGNRVNLKHRRIDWAKTKKFGKIVRHLNLHTFGYYFGIVWDKSYVRFRNNAYYLFKATDSCKATRNGVGKKALSDHIRQLSEDPTKKSYIKI